MADKILRTYSDKSRKKVVGARFNKGSKGFVQIKIPKKK